jgi:hypothetical protein
MMLKSTSPLRRKQKLAIASVSKLLFSLLSLFDGLKTFDFVILKTYVCYFCYVF